MLCLSCLLLLGRLRTGHGKCKKMRTGHGKRKKMRVNTHQFCIGMAQGVADRPLPVLA